MKPSHLSSNKFVRDNSEKGKKKERREKKAQKKGINSGGTRPATFLLESIAKANSSESEIPRMLNQITREEFALYTESMFGKLSLSRKRGEGRREGASRKRRKLFTFFLPTLC